VHSEVAQSVDLNLSDVLLVHICRRGHPMLVGQPHKEVYQAALLTRLARRQQL